MKTMKMHIITVVSIMLFLFMCSSSIAQEPQRIRMQAPPSGGYRMLSDDGKTTFPFEFISKHVVVPVTVNGHTLKLILDTGMPFDGALLFGSDKVRSLGLQYAGKAPVMGVGGDKIESDLAMGVTFNLPGVEFTNQMLLVMPQDSTRSCYFEGKDGVIGHTLFSRFAVRIDHDTMEITLTEPERFAYTGTGQELPLRIDRYPFLHCEGKIGGGKKIPLDLVVDTGNGAALTLNVGAQEGISLPEKVIEYHARSVGRELQRFMGRIEGLYLGPYVLKNLLTSFRTPAHEPAPPWAKAGALGQDALRRFNTIFDYTREKIILEPNSHYDEPFEFPMAGIQFTRTPHGVFQIDRVIPRSPAAEAALRAGDHIVRINGQSVNQLSADEVKQLLRKEGEKVMLDIQRGDQSLQVSLKLRRLI
jgi:hypothetical protein